MEASTPERDLSTVELMRRAVDETKLLARAEVLHAKEEIKQELRAAALGGALFGAAAVLAVCALAVLLAGVGLALPLPVPWGVVLVGVILLACAGLCALLGLRRLPRKPMDRTRRSLEADVALVRERFA